ncbi:helix-turn-helix domain-containing protein [Rhodoferax sp. BLA1]|uniref:helix-turn-helix domain-containing protein n=1 Tax=Rhodoferax sp. BLA1 TaxID=2576062 RepID=UPI0015D1AA72|nr:helix-turn-helix transcriptional regulator [Rhodoferax sp. BLA1]
MTIGKRLKEERERLTLSQTSLAEAAGTTKKTQIDYETDRTPPKANYLAEVAKWGVDVAYVITGERVENVASTPTELAYLRNCRALAEHKMAKLGLDGLTFLRQSKGIEIK